jgi:hypothetical protein
MSSSIRRDFVKAVFGGAAGLSLSAALTKHASGQTGPVTASRLAGNIVLISGAGCNVTIAG